MKKLLNTLYITSPDSYISLDGENVVVLKDDQEVGRVPLHNIEAIITFGYKGASPAVMGACAKRNISLTFMTQSGKYLARIIGETRGNVILRKTQYRYSDNLDESLKIARNIIIGKMYNSKWVIERAIRDYPMRLDINKLKMASTQLHKFIQLVTESDSLDQLRGYEGEAASIYFGVLDNLILCQKEHFYFRGRNKRPPLDNVNALLSFTYTLLSNSIGAALEAVGLDAYVGFLHRDRPGRISLALDLMEELRSVYADRFVISLINRRMINEKDLITREDGAVTLTDEAKKSFLNAWQEKKKESITHPFLDEKVEWGLVPYVQAMLLARYIRGDLDEYPPFLWK
jgi:CRISPR-associated protein Cas1